MQDLARHDLDEAYTALRVGLLRACQGLGIDARSGTAIGNRLGLNRQLAWQLATIAAEPSTAVGLGVIPGSRGLSLFIDASAGDGKVAAVELDALKAAVDRLERAIQTHARDRPTLALLAAAWDSAEMEQRTEDLRRDAHRAQCALLGARVSTQIRGVIFAPSMHGRDDRVAMASYQCLRDITRVRSGHQTRLFYVEAPTHDDGTPDMGLDQMHAFLHEKFRLEPDLSPPAPPPPPSPPSPASSVPPAPPVEYLVDRHRGWVVLGAGPLGQAAASTLAFTGLPRYENPRFVDARNALNQIAFACLMPTETLLVDCLMDKRLAESAGFRASLSFQCFDASTGHPMQPVSSADPAFLYDLTDVSPLGPELLGADSEYAGTAALVARAAQRVGTSPDRLVGVRCRARYVIAPMNIIATRRLPPHPHPHPHTQP